MTERKENKRRKNGEEASRRAIEGGEGSTVHHITYGAPWSPISLYIYIYTHKHLKILSNNFSYSITIFLKVIKGNPQSISYENLFIYLFLESFRL